MKEVNHETYETALSDFMMKHYAKKNSDCRVYTSPMENNTYHKEYCFTDGATFYERIEIITEYFQAEFHGITVDVKADFQRVEYWSTDDSVSKYTYYQI